MRSILLHVDSSDASDARVRWACVLARSLGASLHGLYVQPRPVLPMLPDGVPPSAELMQREEEEIERAAQAAQGRFRAATEAAGCSAAWSSRIGDAAYAIADAARYADLVVVGQHDPDDARSAPADLIAHALLQSGRPIIVTPHHDLPATAAKRVLVAWNDTSQSARAMHDALGLLGTADQVDVVTLSGADDEPEHRALEAVAGFLALHGITPRTECVRDSGAEVGWQLLEIARARGSDLLVMGGYGHSRLRELILGGATREVLHDTPIPVLMSH